MKKFRLVVAGWIVLAALMSSCAAPVSSPTVTSPVESAGINTETVQSLTVMTHDSFAVTESVVRQFEQENQVKLTFLKSGDTGAALNRAILSKEAPQADVFYGVDNTFLSRAVESGIYEPYASPLLSQVPEEFKLDPQNRALPVDYGDVFINYDKAFPRACRT